MAALGRLLRPKSVAVFGGSWAMEVTRQIQRMGFAGDVWPVHPMKPEILGLKAYPDVASLPGAPDASFIGVNRFQTIDIIRDLKARGAGGTVCFASGFSETGEEGARLQADLVAAAGDMPVLGPNCYGFINALDGALLWPDLHGCKRLASGIAFVSQSSNIAFNLTMARRAIPIAYILCLGNQAAVGLHDAINGLADDPRVSVITLHIEAISDPEAFAAACQSARAKGKHLIALKVGRSAGARAMTMSHTASLAGSAAVASAFLARCGVVEVETLPDLLEAAKFLHVVGPISDAGLVSMSCSGGEASLVADTALRAGIAMPAFPPETEAAIRATVNPLVTVSNPFDYHTFDWGALDRLIPTFTEVMRGPQAVTGLILDMPRAEVGTPTGWNVALDALSAARDATGAAAAMIATLPDCMPEDLAEDLARRGVVPLMGLSEAMTALRAGAEAGQFRALPEFTPLPRSTNADGPVASLDEWQAKSALAGFGVIVPEGRFCRTRDEAVAAVKALGPAAMKACGPDLAHKTEANAVVLGVADPDLAAETFDRLIGLAPAVLVERMADKPVAELIVGAARDPALGLYMILGAGGILAELLADSAILMLPLSSEAVHEALDGLRVVKLLAGWRGKPAANIEAIVDAIIAIGDYVVANAATLEELDVNPLIVTPTTAIAVDALIRHRTAHPGAKA
jgi:acyl-CoA synthetase (NDP forming)